MNRYERYIFNQMLLERIMPPNPNNRMFGSHLLFNMFSMFLFFNVFNKQQVVKQPVVNPVQPKAPVADPSEVNKAMRDKIINFVNCKPKNILVRLIILPLQLYIKIILGGMKIVYNALGIKNDNF